MLILLIALPLLTGLAAALPFPSRRGRLTFLLTMQIIETALVVWTLVSGRSYATNIWHLTESLTIAMKLDGVAAVFSALTAVAWLLDGDFMQDRLVPCPIPEYDDRYAFDATRRLIRYVYYIKRDNLFQDLFEKLAR